MLDGEPMTDSRPHSTSGTAPPRTSSQSEGRSSWQRILSVGTAGVLAGLVLFGSGVAQAEPSEEELREEIEDRNDELEEVIEEYNGKREELKDAEDLIDQINEDLPESEAAVEEARDQIADLVTNAHINGDTAFVNAVLSGNSGNIADRMSYLETLTANEQADLQEFVDNVQELEQKKKELETLQEDADEIISDLEEQKEEIEADVADLEYLLDQVTAPEVPDARQPNYNGDNSEVVNFALNQQGEPYVWGSAGPDSWDCSGLVLGSWKQAGVSLPHNVNMQWNQVAKVSRSELQPGDIVFYSGLSHNALYIGNGEVVHAPQTGDVVRVADMDMMGIAGFGRP
ncbi:NlpC/P60 family protein [Haloglycomyces albus]|uniref:C40 family peptidase n=1 Tax=Haloglycomyces albus TaxID=526067 RepID=UPI0004BB0CB1|nr:C40 family peptidase [Haloglycomyces albus]